MIRGTLSRILALLLLAAPGAAGEVTCSLVLESAETGARLRDLVARERFRVRMTLTAQAPFPAGGEAVRLAFPLYYCFRMASRPGPQNCSIARGPAGASLRWLDPEMAELADDAPIAVDLIFSRPMAPGELVEVAYEGEAQDLAMSPQEPGYQPIVCHVVGTDGRPGRELARLSPAVKAGPAARVRLVAPSSGRPGEPFVVRAVLLDACGNPVNDPVAPLELRGHPDPARVRIAQPGIHRLEGRVGAWTARSNPVVVAGGLHRIVFGDLHVHSGEASRDAYGSAELAYRHGRDVALLDFVARTDHDGDLDPALWERSRAMTARWTRPGRFVALLGFEWTPAFAWGHRSVLFPGTAGELVRCGSPSGDTPEELWAAVARHGGLALPHLPSAEPTEHHRYDWNRHDPALEPVVEIDSQWRAVNERLLGRDAETNPAGVQSALSRGYRLGIIAGSDNHTAMPGRTGGLAGMRVTALDAAGLWEAMRARRTFGTSGERMIVELRGLGGRRLEASASGTGPLDRLEIVKGWKGAQVPFRIAHAIECGGREDVLVEWEDPEAPSSAFYYLRAFQKDGARAWSSPVWVDVPGGGRPPVEAPVPGEWRAVAIPAGLEVRPLERPASAHGWRPVGEGAFEVTRAAWTGASETARTMAFRVVTPLFELEQGARYRLSCSLASEQPAMVTLMDESWRNAGMFVSGRGQLSAELAGRRGQVRVAVFFPAAEGRHAVRELKLERFLAR